MVIMLVRLPLLHITSQHPAEASHYAFTSIVSGTFINADGQRQGRSSSARKIRVDSTDFVTMLRRRITSKREGITLCLASSVVI